MQGFCHVHAAVAGPLSGMDPQRPRAKGRVPGFTLLHSPFALGVVSRPEQNEAVCSSSTNNVVRLLFQFAVYISWSLPETSMHHGRKRWSRGPQSPVLGT